MKISTSIAMTVWAAAYLSSCSVSKDSDNQVAPDSSAQEAELKATDDALPEATVMRVKLDDKGKVIAGSETMRIVAATSSTSTADQDFANGQANAQAAKLDELDRASSTQSWSLTSFLFGGNNQNQQNGNYQGQEDQADAGQNNGQNNGFPANQGQVGPGFPNQNPVNQNPVNQNPANQCGNCPQHSTTVCTPCDNQVEHRQGPSRTVYPTSRRTVYEHRTTDVRPVQYVDVFPVEHVRVHPTQVVTNVHPVVQQVEYVGNHCRPQVSACGYGAQFYPTVSYNNYNQYYHYQSHNDRGGYRYFRYCRPRIFARHGW